MTEQRVYLGHRAHAIIAELNADAGLKREVCMHMLAVDIANGTYGPPHPPSQYPFKITKRDGPITWSYTLEQPHPMQ